MTSMRFGRVFVGAVMWLVQPVYILAELLVASRVTAPYDFLDNTVSDLGATTCTDVSYPYGPVAVCSPWHDVMNGATIVFGSLLGLGAILLYRWFPRSRASTVAVVAFAVAGVSSIGVGLVPLDVDLNLHAVVALPGLVAQSVALLALGVAWRRAHSTLAWTALASAVVSVLGLVAFVLLTGSATYGGLTERISLWPGYLVPVAFAVAALRTNRAAVAATGRPMKHAADG